MRSEPTSATRRFMVAARNRGLGREGSVSDSWAGAIRTGRARSVSPWTMPRGGRASSARRSRPVTAVASVSGTAGVSAPSCAAAGGEPADPLEAVGREPARAEAAADAGGQLAQALHHRLERLQAPLAFHRLLEGRHRPPGGERARVLAAGQPLGLDALGPGPLEQPRGGQGRQLSERAQPPAREPGGQVFGEGQQRQRRRGQGGGVATRLDDRRARPEAGGGQRADPACRDAHPDREPPRGGGVTEPLGQAGLVAEEGLETRCVEVDTAGAGLFHAGGVRERDLEEGSGRRRLVRHQ